MKSMLRIFITGLVSRGRGGGGVGGGGLTTQFEG